MISSHLRTLIVLVLALLGIASFIYTQFLIERFVEKDRISIELWAKAIEYSSRELNTGIRENLDEVNREITAHSQISDAQKRRWVYYIENAQSDLANAALDFVAQQLILDSKIDVASILTDADGNIIAYRNIDDRRIEPGLVEEFAAINPPIEIPVIGLDGEASKQFVYYAESALVRSLRFFPYIQFGLLALILGLAYYSIRSIRKTEQSNLWVGMAKEAAHQLGTPLSSLMGWIELLKESESDETLKIIPELQDDASRLMDVAERFNKIGSEPELRLQRVEPVLMEVINYIEKRIPRFGKNVTISRKLNAEVKARINPELLVWAIENLLKNALDAIDTDNTASEIGLELKENNGHVFIEIWDTGKGIEKRHFDEIFKPGFSTKKRGWGLGLSLTKRIIADYHKGDVFVLKSVPGMGTTIRVVLKS